jgi:hypothetical protein
LPELFNRLVCDELGVAWQMNKSGLEQASLFIAMIMGCEEVTVKLRNQTSRLTTMNSLGRKVGDGSARN